MTLPKLVSVVIATYNRSDALLQVLHGLALQSDRNFEVIVADDGSREPHRRAILESPVALQLAITHLWHPDVGFTLAAVRNRGVAVSRGDYVVFLDGDCVPEVDFIARHRALAEPGFLVNGSRILLSTALTEAVLKGAQGICDRSAWFWIWQRLSGRANKIGGWLRVGNWARRKNDGFSWKGIRGCNLAAWREDFDRVDGFDASFVGWGHEDADFVLRLSHAGVVRKNGFWSTEVFHLWHPEAALTQESLNAATVRQRASTDITRAALGYSCTQPDETVYITRLG